MDLYHSLRSNCFMFDNDNYDMPKNVVLAQFTGLQDKNGKDIYEGDIVQLDQWEPKMWEVVFDRGAFCFRNSKEDTYYHDCKYLEDGVLVGNIHDNPDHLLTPPTNE